MRLQHGLLKFFYRFFLLSSEASARPFIETT
jgi:hypothetical protein